MKRIHYLLSILLVALVAGGWVVKDTLNPFEVYTGSNTTPSIAAATSGAVTIGPTAGTATPAVSYSALQLKGLGTGNLSSDTLGLDLTNGWYRNASGTGIASSSQTGINQLFMSRQTTSGGLFYQLSADYQDAQTAGSSVVGTNLNVVHSITAAGAHAIGPTVGAGQTHTLQSGGSTTVSLLSGGSNSNAAQQMRATGTGVPYIEFRRDGASATGSSFVRMETGTEGTLPGTNIAGTDYYYWKALGSSVVAKITTGGFFEGSIRTDNTVGVGNIGSSATAGITVTAGSGTSAVSASSSFCDRAGAVVHCTVTFVATLTTASASSVVTFSALPFRSSNFAAFGDAGGTCATNGANNVRESVWYIGATSSSQNLIVQTTFVEEAAVSRTTVCVFNYKAS